MERYTVEVSRDGDTFLVRMGEGVAEGYVGKGDDVASALEDLARQLRQAPNKHFTRKESGATTA